MEFFAGATFIVFLMCMYAAFTGAPFSGPPVFVLFVWIGIFLGQLIRTLRDKEGKG